MYQICKASIPRSKKAQVFRLIRLRNFWLKVMLHRVRKLTKTFSIVLEAKLTEKWRKNQKAESHPSIKIKWWPNHLSVRETKVLGNRIHDNQKALIVNPIASIVNPIALKRLKESIHSLPSSRNSHTLHQNKSHHKFMNLMQDSTILPCSMNKSEQVNRNQKQKVGKWTQTKRLANFWTQNILIQ